MKFHSPGSVMHKMSTSMFSLHPLISKVHKTWLLNHVGSGCRMNLVKISRNSFYGWVDWLSGRNTCREEREMWSTSGVESLATLGVRLPSDIIEEGVTYQVSRQRRLGRAWTTMMCASESSCRVRMVGVVSKGYETEDCLGSSDTKFTWQMEGLVKLIQSVSRVSWSPYRAHSAACSRFGQASHFSVSRIVGSCSSMT
jgi:hypothetical protein